VKPEIGAPERYWHAQSGFEAVRSSPMSARDRLEELNALLLRTVEQQMVADVPLGAFLSGGIDSSLIVSLMQQVSSRPVHTFTIGFEEPGFNEAEHAAAVARHLGTAHTELYVSSAQAMDVIPMLPSIFDEPFADSSQIPTYLLSKLTRQGVTVALSGDGGDELFCGYERYFKAANAWQAHGKRRASMAGHMRAAALRLPRPIVAPLARLLPGQSKLSSAAIAEKLDRIQCLDNADSFQEFYRTMVSYWTDPAAMVGVQEPGSALADLDVAAVSGDLMIQMRLLDSVSYLPDDILVKVDRAGMAVSLESRMPFLDHRLVEYASRIPTSENVDGVQGKQLLRKLLYRYVPRGLIDRPKQGFAVPIGHWLRGPLRDWAEQLLDERLLSQQGFFKPSPVRRKWVEHLKGHTDYSFDLWGILMFQAWFEQRERDELMQ
jgi:asparagine synthase (glutamine-hydrolysing)